MSKLSSTQRLGLLLDRARRIVSALWLLEARLKGVQIRGPLTLMGRPLISVARDSRLILEPGVSIASSLRSNVLGCFQPSVLRTLEPKAELILGRNVALSGTVVCAGLSIHIGENTICGAGAMVIDNDFHARGDGLTWRNESHQNARPVRIGRGVFVGARAIVLKGVTIGDGAVIGASAVVTKDVPPGQFAVGNPARTLDRRPGPGDNPGD
jgi:acetyltransferase-like isoleucine patch superfamily enzyme